MRFLSGQHLHDIISALAYSFARHHAESTSSSEAFNDITQFVLSQHRRMPDYLRTPVGAVAWMFDGLGWHRSAPEMRENRISAWKGSRFSFKRDWIRYVESLATLAFYDRVSDTSRLSQQGDQKVADGQGLNEPSNELRAEIVVVGSGPGGAITACMLAEAGRDVLLVEEGLHLSLESCEAFSKAEMAQKYRNGGQTVALGKNKIAYVEGRCVGGGSEINSGLYHRTPPEILERWRKEFAVEGLTAADLNPHFEACERDVSVAPLPGPAPAASRKLHDGAMRFGWKSIEVPRWFCYEPGQPSGKRQSMTETFIPRFLRAKGRLLPRTRVNRLRRNGSGWLLEASHESAGDMHISADSLFLAAGAVHTPTLLRRSGITQNIGNSLQVHPTVKIVARFNDVVNSADMGVPVHQVKEFAPRFSLGCSISSPPYLALGLMDHPNPAQEISGGWNNLAVYYAMITSEGRGTVRTVPGFRDPLVRYRLTENDRRNLADGLRKLSEVLFESGATALYPALNNNTKLNCTGCITKLPDILQNGSGNLMTIHLFSSCPMGEDKSKSAADSFGRVHGFKNLHINDASLLCTAPGVNPQGSVMAIARRNALNFLGKL